MNLHGNNHKASTKTARKDSVTMMRVADERHKQSIPGSRVVAVKGKASAKNSTKRQFPARKRAMNSDGGVMYSK